MYERMSARASVTGRQITNQKTPHTMTMTTSNARVNANARARASRDVASKRTTERTRRRELDRGRSLRRASDASDDDRGDRTSDELSRRRAMASIASAMACAREFASANVARAAVPVAEVTTAGALGALETQTVEVFARASASAVNVVDLTVLSTSGSASLNAGAIVAEGNGTGVVWSDDGYVVTNYHVIAGVLASIPKGRRVNEVAKVTIQTEDGSRTFGAALVGASREKDLVVLQINAPKALLKPVALGTSSAAVVGQAVFAIGNPFGFDHTLTTGVISGLNRSIQSQAGSLITGAIQCDAAINPGNSGGPLLDGSGRLIGINTAIFTPNGSSTGVGFAIPVDTVKTIVSQLIKNGEVILPSLNIAFGDANLMRDLKIPLGSGALVQSFVGDSLAAKAGILATRRGMSGIAPGDVIIEVDGRKVSIEADVVAAVERKSVGDVVKVRVKRLQSPGDTTPDVLYFDVPLAPADSK